jgi:putative transposase
VNHCTWRAHNLAFVLDAPGARAKFLWLLANHKNSHGIQIHAYCLMSSHPHVVCTSTRGQGAFSAFWKVVNQRFARWYNRRTQGRGQVVMDRTRSPRVQAGDHLLRVIRYGDMNPVRAGMVRRPKDWPWSSHRHYAYGEPNPLITDPPEYVALGSTATQRRRNYLHLFRAAPIAPFLRRCPELVLRPFIGDPSWVRACAEAPGPAPPAR